MNLTTRKSYNTTNDSSAQGHRLGLQNGFLRTPPPVYSLQNNSAIAESGGGPQQTQSKASNPSAMRLPTASSNLSQRSEGQLEISENASGPNPSEHGIAATIDPHFDRSRDNESDDASSTPGSDAPEWTQFSLVELRHYLWDQGKWRYLAGTSICWCLLDFAFYGLGLNKANTLAKIWADKPTPSGPGLPTWRTQSTLPDPNPTIYDVLYNEAKQSLLSILIGSLVGSIMTILAINRLDRRDFLVATFLVLAVLLCITGGTLLATFHTEDHAATIVLYALCQTIFSFGPNTLLFIVRLLELKTIIQI